MRRRPRYYGRHGDESVDDVEHRVAGDEGRGVAVVPEAEMDESNRSATLPRTRRLLPPGRRCSTGIGTTFAGAPARLERSWMRLRSGSAAGAIRSSTW